MRFGFIARLAPDGAQGGSGGSGGTGDGGQSQTPKILTAEEIANIANSAYTAHEARTAKKREEQLQKMIADAVKAAMPAPADGGAQGSGTGGTGAQGATGNAGGVSPEVAALQARIDGMEKAAQKRDAELKTEREARTAAENTARDDRTFGEMRAMLAPHVRPDMVDDVALLHFHAHKRVTYGEDGKPLFRVRRAPATGMAEEDVQMPLKDGVDYWLKSKDAQRYLPAPKGSGGDGPSGNAGGNSRGGRPPPARKYDSPAQTDDERARRAMERERELRESGFNPE
jgi:hypothetical protein